MRKYAILDNNTVTEILDLDDEGCRREATYHSVVVDIQDFIVQPQLGWILNGNQLIPPPSQAVNLKELVKARIKLYQDSAPELLRDFYATNTLLGLTVQQSDQLFADYQDVLVRLREGAWPTAIYRLSQKEPMGFVTEEMISNWVSLIQSRMNG